MHIHLSSGTFCSFRSLSEFITVPFQRSLHSLFVLALCVTCTTVQVGLSYWAYSKVSFPGLYPVFYHEGPGVSEYVLKRNGAGWGNEYDFGIEPSIQQPFFTNIQLLLYI